MLPRVRLINSATLPIRVTIASTLALLCLLAACTSSYGPVAYQHGRAYAGPTRYYPPPGTPEDPWGPYILAASAQFDVPELWIREVMRQESDGQEQAVSSAGAMGLMQIMPATFDDLRRRYGLGSDPFEPHDNITAGAAYIREMYDSSAHLTFSRRTMQGHSDWTATSVAVTRYLMKPSIISPR